MRSGRDPVVLGIVPARRGSKGIPDKNIRRVAGAPLVTWTWRAAARARSLDRVIVSTDDPRIARLARRAGVDVPFVRPRALASDTAGAVDVVIHALDWLERRAHYRPDAVMWLQPTSPLRTGKDIDAAIELFRRKRADSVVSVSAPAHHPYWMKRVDARGRLTAWANGAPFPQRRQALPPVFQLNGAIYLTRREVLVSQRTFHPARTYAYVMPPGRSLDVDTPWDLKLADLLLTAR